MIAALSAIGWKAPRRHERHFWREYKAGTKPIQPAAFAIRTLRKVFGASDPASLQIWCGVASMGGIARLLSESSIDLPVLVKGEEVTNLTTGAVYRIGKRLGHGGFGAVYRVTRTRPARAFRGKLCLKVAVRPEAWHREAYFGELLEGQPRAIAVHDSFAMLDDGPYSGERPLYCLMTELAAHGDLVSYLQRRTRPWTLDRGEGLQGDLRNSPRVVHRHNAGAVHRDLTPSDVLVAEGEHLKLGDFSIARHRLQGRSVQADVFNHGFAALTVAHGSTTSSWRAADDVYQMGLILTALLGGSAEEKADSADARNLHCSRGLKAVIQRSIGDRRKRYIDAAAMIETVRGRNDQHRSRVSLPRSLRAKIRRLYRCALHAASRGLPKRMRTVARRSVPCVVSA
jgi:serine/threonine protein kinase